MNAKSFIYGARIRQIGEAQTLSAMTGFNPDVFRWARESAGFTVEEAARAAGIAPSSVVAFERGERAPSRSALEKMAKAYRRSLLTLYMPAPPRTGDRGADFRSVVAERSVQSDARLDALVRDLMARQSLVRTVLEDDEDAEKLAFIGSVRVKDGVGTAREVLEQVLGVSRTEYRSAPSAGEAFALLRAKAESSGVFVLLVGNLGSHHSDIPVEAFRGFAIADPIAPFVAINDKDAKVAWSFTLLHEFVHLLIGETGVSAGTPDQEIERFCNDVASGFLVSSDELESVQIAGLSLAEKTVVLDRYADQWRVSRQLVAYSLYRHRRIAKNEWQEVDTELRAQWAAERRRRQEQAQRSDSRGGPNYYVIKRHRLGKGLLSFVQQYLGAGVLSPAKAAKVLGVKPRSVYALLSSLG